MLLELSELLELELELELLDSCWIVVGVVVVVVMVVTALPSAACWQFGGCGLVVLSRRWSLGLVPRRR